MMKKPLKDTRWSALAAYLFLLTMAPVASAQEPPQPAPPDNHTSAATATKNTGEPAVKAPPSPVRPTPLSAGQKLEYGAKSAFLNPGAFIGPAFEAYFTERNELRVAAKTKEDYFADGLSFYARGFARQSTAKFLASGVYPALFHQDPRYHPSPDRRFCARLLYATSRTLLTRSDAGRAQYNYSKLGGFLTSAALANIYERNTAKTIDAQGRIIRLNQRTGTAATFRNFGFLVAGDVIENVFFNEFHLGDKMRRAFRKIF